jgi:hypothetical protein
MYKSHFAKNVYNLLALLSYQLHVFLLLLLLLMVCLVLVPVSCRLLQFTSCHIA